MKQEETTLVSFNQKVDKLASAINELAEVINESFSKMQIYFEEKIGVVEKTMATKTQVEVLTDVLRTNGVVSRFEARKISKAQPAL